jgi:cysteine-rich repeat protein
LSARSALASVAAALAAAAALGCNGLADIGAPILDPCFDGCGGSGGAPGAATAGGGPTGPGGAPATTSTSAVTTTTGPTPMCGDGHLDPGEECDDGNVTNGDGCSQDCHIECDSPGEFLSPTSLHCYFAASDHPGASWDDARAFCAAMHADLAAVTSQDELDLVASQLDGVAWIGGQVSPSGFTWTDGEPWSFAPWRGPAQPPFDPHKACVVLDDDHFDVDDCNAKHAFLCERAPAGSP